MNGYHDLERRVIDAGGLLQITVEQLRDLEGAGKLGAHVRDAISRQLRLRQLHTLERSIPNDQRASVWLISPNTPWGDMLWQVVTEIRGAARSAA